MEQAKDDEIELPVRMEQGARSNSQRAQKTTGVKY